MRFRPPIREAVKPQTRPTTYGMRARERDEARCGFRQPSRRNPEPRARPTSCGMRGRERGEARCAFPSSHQTKRRAPDPTHGVSHLGGVTQDWTLRVLVSLFPSHTETRGANGGPCRTHTTHLSLSPPSNMRTHGNLQRTAGHVARTGHTTPFLPHTRPSPPPSPHTPWPERT